MRSGACYSVDSRNIMSIVHSLAPDSFRADVLSSTGGGELQLGGDVRERNTRVRY